MEFEPVATTRSSGQIIASGRVFYVWQMLQRYYENPNVAQDEQARDLGKLVVLVWNTTLVATMCSFCGNNLNWSRRVHDSGASCQWRQ